MKKLLTTAAIAAFALGTAANAAILEIQGGTYSEIPNIEMNDVLGGLGFTSLGGYYGGNIYLSEDASISVEYLGSEAGFKNSFNLEMGAVGFDNRENSAGQMGSAMASGGLLDFSFMSQGSSSSATLANGDNPDVAGGTDFFASFDGTNATDSSNGNMLWLFFNDPGSSDADYDDLVVRVSVASISAIPLPAAALPLLTALGGLGALGLRRRRKERAA